jgi:hypothetical protein
MRDVIVRFAADAVDDVLDRVLPVVPWARGRTAS